MSVAVPPVVDPILTNTVDSLRAWLRDTKPDVALAHFDHIIDETCVKLSINAVPPRDPLLEEMARQLAPERGTFRDAARMNRASQRDILAPVTAQPRHYSLAMDMFKANPRIRNSGFGGAVIRTILQGLTRRTDGLQWFTIFMAYFPTFYTVDSFFNFRISPTKAATDAEEIPAGRLFPRDIDLNLNEGVNKKADLAYAGLFWCTPIMTALARAAAFAAPTASFTDLNAWLAACSSGAFHARALDTIAPVLRISGHRLAALLPGVFAAAVSDHCIKLGSRDPSGALFLEAGALLHVDRRTTELVLSFLVDHCRVMARPLVVAAACAATLCDAYGVASLQALFDDSPTYPIVADAADLRATNTPMPRPAPHFERVGIVWLWLPVKKPHSTDYATGTTWTRLPAREPSPWAGLEPPTKRARTDAPVCLACAGPLAGAGHTHALALCTESCATLYYE